MLLLQGQQKVPLLGCRRTVSLTSPPSCTADKGQVTLCGGASLGTGLNSIPGPTHPCQEHAQCPLGAGSPWVRAALSPCYRWDMPQRGAARWPCQPRRGAEGTGPGMGVCL